MQFKIASQTKAFTANLVLQLVGEDKVALDDHISKWIDGVPNGDEITIRQLLNHTSGLADGFTIADRPGPGADGLHRRGAVHRGRQVPHPSPSRARSGPTATTATTCSGRVVELVEGKDLSTVLQERIAEPLGLTRTSLPNGQRSHRALHPRLRHRRPRPHADADGRQ